VRHSIPTADADAVQSKFEKIASEQFKIGDAFDEISQDLNQAESLQLAEKFELLAQELRIRNDDINGGAYKIPTLSKKQIGLRKVVAIVKKILPSSPVGTRRAFVSSIIKTICGCDYCGQFASCNNCPLNRQHSYDGLKHIAN